MVGTSLVVIILTCFQDSEFKVLSSIFSGIAALSVGSIVGARTLALQDGLIEFAAVIGTMLILSVVAGNTKKTVIAIVLGYSFAFAGHFMFEKNQPTSLVYPTLSLASDFYMWWAAITLVRASTPRTSCPCFRMSTGSLVVVTGMSSYASSHGIPSHPNDSLLYFD